MNRVLLLSALTVLALPAQGGVLLKLLETEYTNGPLKARIEVPDVLSRDAAGKPHLNLHPDTNADHAALLKTLTPGLQFDEPGIRDQIAEILVEFPSTCVIEGPGPGLHVGLLVSPVEDIDIFIPGVVDKRRIGSVYLSGCLAENPPECFYDRSAGAFTFGPEDLFRELRKCRDATQAAALRGAHYHADIEAAHQEAKTPTKERRP